MVIHNVLTGDKFQEEYCVVYGNINLVLNDLCRETPSQRPCKPLCQI